MLSTTDATPSEQVLTVWVPTTLVVALDAEAARRRVTQPGVRVTRANTVRALLLGALPPPSPAVVGGSARRRRRPSRPPRWVRLAVRRLLAWPSGPPTGPTRRSRRAPRLLWGKRQAPRTLSATACGPSRSCCPASRRSSSGRPSAPRPWSRLPLGALESELADPIRDRGSSPANKTRRATLSPEAQREQAARSSWPASTKKTMRASTTGANSPPAGSRLAPPITPRGAHPTAPRSDIARASEDLGGLSQRGSRFKNSALAVAVVQKRSGSDGLSLRLGSTVSTKGTAGGRRPVYPVSTAPRM